MYIDVDNQIFLFWKVLAGKKCHRKENFAIRLKITLTCTTSTIENTKQSSEINGTENCQINIFHVVQLIDY